MPLYQNLPKPPQEITPGTMLARLIDSTGYRYQLATEGLTANELDFRPVEGSMNMMELLHHIYLVLFWAYWSIDPTIRRQTDLDTFEDYRQTTLALCRQFSEHLSKMETADLEKAKIHLKRTGKDYSIWYMVNGPMTDALTHIGQINSWRRIAGNPCARVSPFTGEPY